MKASPPKLAKRLLKLLCAQAYHEEVEGDLDELYAYNFENAGKRVADQRYWGDVLKHFNRYFILKRSSSSPSQNLFDMWTNYAKIAIRNMLKSKRYTLMNILGLGVGMACATLILIYSNHELSFDKFHENAQKLHIVHTTFTEDQSTVASAPNALVPALIRELPEVESGVRIFNRSAFRPYTVKYKENIFQEDRLFHVDSTFFDVFSFELLDGNKETCLDQPRSIVLTEETARKYFGNEDSMGKTLRIDNRSDYVVTGILKSIPSNSHIHFDFLVPYRSLGRAERWNDASYTSYLVLSENISASQVEQKIPPMLARLAAEREHPIYTVKPFLDIHLSGLGAAFGLEAQNEMRYLYIFGFIGVLILTIASINYTNLATARAVFRAKEIGMRKVLGAYRFNLFHQFMGESLMIVVFAVLLSYVLAIVALPSFNVLADRSFAIADLFKAELIGGTLLIALFVGLLAGIYPSLVLSRFRPIVVLKGSFKNSKSGVVMRKFLVVSQFVISIGLIIGTVVVFEQLSYMQEKKLGYNNDNMLILPLSTSIKRNYDAFKSEMLREPGILDLTLASASPTKIESGYTFSIKDMDIEKKVFVAGLRADTDFLGALQMTLIAGEFINDVDLQNASWDLPSAERNFAFVFNEQALVPFGLSPEEALGKRVHMNGRNGFIKGVTKDFHFASMREKIRPMVFLPETDFNHVLVRISGQNIESTLSKVQDRWRKLAPNVPFEYEFMDVEYQNLYRSEQKLSTLFGAFAVLAIFIACFGLLGLVSYATIQKAQEIGVRKVLGASVNNLVLMLNKDFIKLVLFAFLLSAPLSYFLMKGWLNDFEYRISIGLTPIALALIITLGLAFLTVSIQSIRAAMANPVDVLKEE